MKTAPFLAALLAACGQQADDAPANRASEQVAPAPAPAAQAFAFEEKNGLIEFDYSWSAEAAAVPQLVKRFRAEMDKARAELIANAEEEKAYRDKQGMEFHQYSSTTALETAGQSARLLSLREDGWAYTGGAHGNGGTAALLWDRAARKEMRFADLFVQPANRDRLLTQRWCDALARAREEKRGETEGGGGMFDDCPPLDDIALIPVDSDKDGRFDRLQLVASPYVAGPYVEGSYEIELAVTPDLLAGLKSDFRPSFEAQGLQ